MKKSITVAIAACFAAVPAMAQDQNASWNDRAKEKARTATGVIYGAAATAACRSRACAPVGNQVGESVFDKTSEASTRGAEKIQAFGRRLRKRGN